MKRQKTPNTPNKTTDKPSRETKDAAQVQPLPPQQRGEIIVKLGAWCDARNRMAVLRRELDAMDIDIRNNPLVRDIAREMVEETAERVRRETAERVERKTLTDAIVTVLRGRFPRKLPAHLRPRLATCSLEQLHEIMKRSVTADSAAEALEVALDRSPSIAPR